ncbi:MAG: hypothetical protein OXC07_03745 [Kistimonas sp.]|nr:hypothetical protein [Kistimonas sp.]
MALTDSGGRPGTGTFDYLTPDANGQVRLSHFLSTKAGRKSWNNTGVLNQSRFLEKQEVFLWVEMLGDMSIGSVNEIVFEGLLGGELENLSFILGLAGRPDFMGWTSSAVYDLLYDFVIATPVFVQEWLEPAEFDMCRDVLALLARKGDWR